MSPYRILLHPDTLARLQDYRRELATQGLEHAGQYLQRALAGQDLRSLTDAAFLERLFATKPPLIFAESAVYGDGRDWNPTELTLLGDCGVAVTVLVFDDGRHHAPRLHPEPWPATLLYIPGALLRNDTGHAPADWAAVTEHGRIDPAAYQTLYTRRLLPLFLYAQQTAATHGRQALITLPGLGCGQFAGPFRGTLGEQLRNALSAILEQHSARLPNIRAVYYDPYAECQNERREFGALSLLIRPLTHGNEDKPQLCPPIRYAEAGDDFANCELFSIVAWDHVSWPGNDFYGGSRATDDGVKAAATSSMYALTGTEGQYDPVRQSYQPPTPFRTWGEIVRERALTLTVAGNLCVLG